MAEIKNIDQLHQGHYDALGAALFELGYQVSPDRSIPREMVVEAAQTHGDELYQKIADYSKEPLDIADDLLVGEISQGPFAAGAEFFRGKTDKLNQGSWKDYALAVMALVILYLLFAGE